MISQDNGKKEKCISPEKNLIQRRMSNSATCLLTMVFTNIFYILILFLAWYIPISALIGASGVVGVFIMLVVMGKACLAMYDEEHTFMQELLIYYPVNAKRLCFELFKVMWKYIGIQVVITCIPMLMMAVGFNIERFVITLAAVLVSMTITGLIVIMGSMKKLSLPIDISEY